MHVPGKRSPRSKIEVRKNIGALKSHVKKEIEDPKVINSISDAINELCEILNPSKGSKVKSEVKKIEGNAKENKNRARIKKSIEGLKLSSDSVQSCSNANQKVMILLEILGPNHKLAKEFISLNKQAIKGQVSVEELTNKLKQIDQIVTKIDQLDEALEDLHIKAIDHPKILEILDQYETAFLSELDNSQSSYDELSSNIASIKDLLNTTDSLKSHIQNSQDFLLDHDLDSNPTSTKHKEVSVYKLLADECQKLSGGLSVDNIQDTTASLIKLSKATASIELFLQTGIHVNKADLEDFPLVLSKLESYEAQLNSVKELTGNPEIDSDGAAMRVIQLFESGILDSGDSTKLLLQSLKGDFFTILNNKDNVDIFDLVSNNNQSAKWRVSYDTFIKLLVDCSDDRSDTLIEHAANLLEQTSQNSGIDSPVGVCLALLASSDKIADSQIDYILENLTQNPADLLASVLSSIDSSIFTSAEKTAIAGVLTGTLTHIDIQKKEEIIQGVQKKLSAPKIQLKVQESIQRILANQGNLTATLTSACSKMLFDYTSSAAENLANKKTVFGQDQLTKPEEVLLSLVSNNINDATPAQTSSRRSRVSDAVFKKVDSHIKSIDQTNPFANKLDILKNSTDLKQNIFISSKKTTKRLGGVHESYKTIHSIKENLFNCTDSNVALSQTKQTIKNYLKKQGVYNQRRIEKLQVAIRNTKEPLGEILSDVFNQTLVDIKSVDKQLMKKIDQDQLLRLDSIQLEDFKELNEIFVSENNPILTDIQLESLIQLPNKNDLTQLKEIYAKQDPIAQQKAKADFNKSKRSVLKMIFRRKPNNVFSKMDTQLQNTATLMGVSKQELLEKYETFLDKENKNETVSQIKQTIKNRKKLLKVAQRDISDGLRSHKKRDKFIHLFKKQKALHLTENQLKGIKKSRLLLSTLLAIKLKENPNQDITVLLNNISKKLEQATKDIRVLDTENFEESRILKQAYRYLSSDQTADQIKTYFKAAIADLAQAKSIQPVKQPLSSNSPKESTTPTQTKIRFRKPKVDPKTRYVIKQLRAWTDINMTNKQKAQFNNARLKTQSRFEESDLVALNKQSYQDLFDKTKEGEIIKIEFKNVYGISTKLLKPVLTVVAPGAQDSEITIGYENNKGISISYDVNTQKYKVSMSKEISKKLALSLKGKVADVTLTGSRDTENSITFSLNEDQMMELTPHFLQAELTSEDIKDNFYQADFGKKYKTSAELSLNVLGAKLPKFIQEPLNQIIGTKQEIDQISKLITDQVGSSQSANSEFLREFNEIEKKKESLNSEIKPKQLHLKTTKLEDILSASTDSSASNQAIETYQNEQQLDAKNTQYAGLLGDYQALLNKYPEIKQLLPSEDDLSKDIKEALNSRVSFTELLTGISLKGSRETGTTTTSGGLTEIKYKKYSGSVSLDVLGNKMPAEYSVKTTQETQPGSNIILDQYSEESYIYNKYSPFNKSIHQKLAGFKDLPIFSLPITVKRGLSNQNKAIFLQLPETEKSKFLKDNSEIIEISTTLPLSKSSQSLQELSTTEKVKKQLISALGVDHNETLQASQLKRFVLFDLNDTSSNPILKAA